MYNYILIKGRARLGSGGVPLPLETKVKGSILTPCKAGGLFLPLVEPEVTSLPLVGVGLFTSQPPHTPWKTNYNMHSMGKTIAEPHAMLKLAEKCIYKKAFDPAVLAIIGGKI
ncbi:hypothetical protein Tco_1058733 [Tanacetum coccineum]|uniref:Uncharacterized protein n=1 Tax=Tanacetum coccineum TaxID=301880 RepID=A0ABQ5H953_9ASTR